MAVSSFWLETYCPYKGYNPECIIRLGLAGWYHGGNCNTTDASAWRGYECTVET